MEWHKKDTADGFYSSLSISDDIRRAHERKNIFYYSRHGLLRGHNTKDS